MQVVCCTQGHGLQQSRGLHAVLHLQRAGSKTPPPAAAFLLPPLVHVTGQRQAQPYMPQHPDLHKHMACSHMPMAAPNKH